MAFAVVKDPATSTLEGRCPRKAVMKIVDAAASTIARQPAMHFSSPVCPRPAPARCCAVRSGPTAEGRDQAI